MTKKKSEHDEKLLATAADSALSAVEAAGDGAEALVNAWVKAGNAAAVGRVAQRGEGKARKAARRGLNVLKSRGISVEEEPHVASLTGERAEASVEAWMLAPDTGGNLLLVVASRPAASRYRAAFVFLHDAHGIVRVEVGEMSASGLKEAMAKVLPGAQYKPVAVPVDWARHRIAAARKVHASSGRPEPLGLTSAQALLEPVPPAAPSHPFDDEGLELAEEDAKELGAESTKLHALPEFRGWFPTRAAVDEMLAKIGETLTPGEEPPQDELQKRLEEEIRAATDRYFSPERRAELVRAMRDSALSVLAREGEQKALNVVASIKCIEGCGLITDPPHEVGFLRGFFEKAVSLLLARGGGSLRIPVAGQRASTDSSAPSAEAG